jgi:hypothetical protein
LKIQQEMPSMNEAVLQIHSGAPLLQFAGRLLVTQAVAPVVRAQVVSQSRKTSCRKRWDRHIQEGMVGAVWADTRAARTAVEKRMDSCIFVYFLLLLRVGKGKDAGEKRGVVAKGGR